MRCFWWVVSVFAVLVTGCGGAPVVDVSTLPRWTPAEPAGFATLTVEDAGARRALAVASLDVDVTVRGRLAVTRVTQVFQNAQQRPVDGTWEMVLPPSAAVTRLAMDVDGVMTEGELVERERARAIYDTVTAPRLRDPAIMEALSLERFRTRIFPIPARGTKTVIVEYEQLLAASTSAARYVYALPSMRDGGGEAIGAFTFALDYEGALDDAVVGGYPVVVERVGAGRVRATMAMDAFVPGGPLTVDLVGAPGAVPEASVSTASRTFPATDRPDEDFFLADVVVGDATERRALPRSLVVVLDTSASLGTDAQVWQGALAQALVDGVAPDALEVYVGSLEATRCQPGVDPASASSADVASCLDRHRAGGATDLGRLVATGIERAAEREGDLVVISDGWATLGELERDALSARWSTARADRAVTVHTVAVGVSPDEETLRVASGLTGGQHLRVPPGADVAEAARVWRARLARSAVTDLEARVVDGAAQTLYVSSRAAAAGDIVSVWGRTPPPGAAIELSGRQGGERWQRRVELAMPGVSGDAPDALSHLWARSRIAELEGIAARRDEVVALSRDYGVLSRHTALLVLENEAMYREYAVERRQQAAHDAAVARGAREAWTGGAAAYDADWHGLGEAVGPVDSDHDGIPDSDDMCPFEPETFNGDRDEDGCPDGVRHVIIRDSDIRIVEHIVFRSGKVALRPESGFILEEVARVLADHPSIELVAIEGHTDDREVSSRRREPLSLARAEAVRDRLVELGVEHERLMVVGFGSERPLSDPSTEHGRERNRRVEFRLVRANGEWMDPQAEMRHLERASTRSPVEEARLIELYLQHGREGDGDALYDAYLAAHGADPDALVRLYEHPFVRERHGEAFVDAVVAWPEVFSARGLVATAYLELAGAGEVDGLERLAVAAPLDDGEVMGRVLSAAHGAGHHDALGRWLSHWCEMAGGGDALERCIVWLDRYGAGVAIDVQVSTDARARRLAEIVERRGTWPGELIVEHARLLERLGRREDAIVVLTELVEHEPRVGEVHLELGQELLDIEAHDAGCGALRNAVLLDAGLLDRARAVAAPAGCVLD